MTDATIFVEKRAHDRFMVKIPVTYQLLDEKHKDEAVKQTGAGPGIGHAMDTSLGGMYIVSEKALKHGDHLSVQIAMHPPDPPLTVLADVVWADGKGAGLRFLAMKEQEVKILETFLDKLQKP